MLVLESDPDVVQVGECVRSALEYAEDRKSACPIDHAYVSLTRILGPLMAPALVVVGSDSQVGRSTFVHDLCRSACVAQEHSSLLFSPRVSKRDIGVRLLSAHARITPFELFTERLTGDTLSRVDQAKDDLRRSKLRVVEPITKMSDVIRMVGNDWLTNDTRLVVVDDADELSRGEYSKRSVLHELRHLAHLFNVVVVATVCLERMESDTSATWLETRRLPDDAGRAADISIRIEYPDMHDEGLSSRPGEVTLHIRDSAGEELQLDLCRQLQYARFTDMSPQT